MKKLFYLAAIFCILLTMRCVDKEWVDSKNIDDQKIEDKLYPHEGLVLAKQFPLKTLNPNVRNIALLEAKRMAENEQRSNGIWVTQGPGNIGARINTIAISPLDSNLMVIGYATGGVFLTQDGGISWEPIFDQQVNLSIGDLVFHPTEKNTIFAATGDPNIGGYFSVGDGLWKSTNLGESWTYLGLRECNILSKITFDPNDPNTIFVGSMGAPFQRDISTRGIFKSSDGGSTWSQIFTIDEKTGVTDIIIDPTNADIMYASAWTRLRSNKESVISSDLAGIYKSIDGGQNWAKLSGGLPTEATSRCGLAMDPSDPTNLYATFVDRSSQGLLDIFRSEDGGASWRGLGANESDASGVYAGFGWYFCGLAVDPDDRDKLYIQGVDLWEISDKDSLSAILATPEWFTYEVHADKHDIVFEGNFAYLATDGGLYKSDKNNLPFGWQKIEDNATSEFYRVGYNPHLPEFFIGGAQDNGTTGGNEATIKSWERIFGGDGFQPAFHQDDDQVWFAETQRGGIVMSQNAGFDWEGATAGLRGSRHWDMQYVISPHEDMVMYTATDQVYKSTTIPPQWEAISDSIVDNNADAFIHQATSIDQSKMDPNLLVVGTSDGLAWRSIDEGTTWEKMLNGLPNRYVTSIKTSPNNANNIYVTYSGYRDGQYEPRIYKSNDKGLTFVNIADGLPDLPVNDIYILPYGNDDQYLMIGTDGGVYFSTDNGESWNRLGENMPYIATLDLEYDPTTNALIAATHGGSIKSFDLNQVGISPVGTTENDLTNFEIKVYPNPFTEHISVTVNHSNLKDKFMTIYDHNGKKVKSVHNLKRKTIIDLSSLANGIYYLTFEDQVKKIVKME